MTSQQEATSVHAVPAQWLERGFRLLILRELHTEKEPPAFAWIEQHLLRTPQRLTRHGLFFGRAFLPEIMAWLIEHLGRASRERAGRPHRNALWPMLSWYGERRLWPDGIRTTEWFVDVIFQDEGSWTAFQRRWHGRLMGNTEASETPPR
jgi:hypothetical protein